MQENRCVRCGQINAGVISNGKFFCAECFRFFNTCVMCVHSKKCDFQDNHAPMPQFVMQRVRQQTEMGYIEQIQQVPNPQRVKAMCVESECVCCKECEDKKYHCIRQFEVCEKYEEIEF